MDKAERMARDLAYVERLKFAHRNVVHWAPPKLDKRELGMRKDRLFPCRCSKKTPGRPKRPHGCCCGEEGSPKVARGIWKLQLDE